MKLDHFRSYPAHSPKNQVAIVSIQGAHSKKFTHEYPMERADARILWDAFRSFVQTHHDLIEETRHETNADLKRKDQARLDQLLFDFLSERIPRALQAELGNDQSAEFKQRSLSMKQAASRIRLQYVAMEMDFAKEGDVLEALWPYAATTDQSRLMDHYPPQKYFYTGGLEYYRPDGTAHGRLEGEIDVLVARKDNCQVVVIGEAKLGLAQYSHASDQVTRFLTYLRDFAPKK